MQSVDEMFGTLGFIGDVFTPERVAWKIKLVQSGFETVGPLIPKVLILKEGMPMTFFCRFGSERC